ncbi:sensory transduction histidine kinase [Enhygromyxa salina]|uniref:Sensory transduction histidine kinase n=1 Tax=Enhygromyxa salina TaxID=215803 RepID=A0A0C1Z984_9BACT|nr:MEDS domain-containing protein [Enhygromyxa salina]KIG14149.1 sensory transduction histidine kinase [Enhygromyxa salina]
MNHRRNVSLGFTEGTVPAGTHICQIFNDDDERNDVLVRFILSGLRASERVTCFSERANAAELETVFTAHDLSYAQLTASEAFSLAPTSKVYFEGGQFDPERMLERLACFYDEGVAQGYVGSRILGEMIPEVHELPGGSRLFEYEARISLLLQRLPLTAVCQYDARSFDGATILDVLRVHPMMLVRGSVVHNPFFIPPEVFLA